MGLFRKSCYTYLEYVKSAMQLDRGGAARDADILHDRVADARKVQTDPRRGAAGRIASRPHEAERVQAPEDGGGISGDVARFDRDDRE